MRSTFRPFTCILTLVLFPLSMFSPVLQAQQIDDTGKTRLYRTDYEFRFDGYGNGAWWLFKDSSSTPAGPLVRSDGFVYTAIGPNGPVFGGTWLGAKGWQPGPFAAGNPPADPRVYHTGRFTPEEWEALPEHMRSSFLHDMTHWPVERGAPFLDADGDGAYNPDLTAFPAFPGDAPMPIADEAMWSVTHDGGPLAEQTWGQSTVGLEFRHLIWAMAEGECADHIFFQRLRIVNRSDDFVRDIRLGLHADIVLGDPSDDVVGYDSTIGLAYAYNADDTDAVLGNPPALGYLLLQGIAEDAEGETGLFDLRRVRGIRNQPPSAFTFFSHDGVYREVPDPDNANLPMQLSAALQGLLPDGSPQRDPLSGAETRFAAGGNPISQMGWVDGRQHAPGNRVMLLSFGPFDLAPGAFQEIVFSRFVVEGGEARADVHELLYYALCVIEQYGYQFPLDIDPLPMEGTQQPAEFIVERLWPQPLPRSSSVLSMRISGHRPLHIDVQWTDILGRTLADHHIRLHPPASTVTLSRPDVPKGIYFLHLRGDRQHVVKTVVLR